MIYIFVRKYIQVLSSSSDNRLSNERKFIKNISLNIYNGISRNVLDSSNIFLRILRAVA